MHKLHQTDFMGNNWPTLLPPELSLPAGLLNVSLPILLTPGPLRTDNGMVDVLVTNEFRVVNNMGDVVWSGAGMGAVAIPLGTLIVGGGYVAQQRTVSVQLGYSPWSTSLTVRV